VTVTLGGLYLLGRVTSMSIFCMNAATLLGLAVAIDYALFIVSRFREELARGATVEEAVVVTTARAGRSVFYSGAAVMVGVVGLLFFPSRDSFDGYRRCAGGLLLRGGFGDLHAGAHGRARHRVNSVPVIKLHATQEGPIWKKWAGLVLKRPWVTIVVSLVLIVLVAAPPPRWTCR